VISKNKPPKTGTRTGNPQIFTISGPTLQNQNASQFNYLETTTTRYALRTIDKFAQEEYLS